MTDDDTKAAAAVYAKECANLRDRFAELEAENARLWAWHDAVMAQKQSLESGRTFHGMRWEYVSITRPQPMTRGK